ncbi:restriction endonuclease subunit M [Candidatus Peribacteria bacterium RIFCSPHIGHO2_02_FULL_52_16]|nr:MAG: restriction endonuclease subunit M [Candidatus Peribacteria bacterium RIFCSPHIGHO2_01_FULL_51_35]OGJ60838.1 MAG: restriction endonuclease subunit M [Candidatus Peribacteria bacterium RIFCSPHIGHO2_02_FULL_52_16]
MTLVTLQEASQWAAKHLAQEVSLSNISYLVQYGKVKKYGENGSTKISLEDLKKYYQGYKSRREVDWKKILGADLNWGLSFDHLREIDTTKHVHRLHPYKGKFIPQLVEYFLGNHTDDFKKKIYFKKGDVVLDPFLGSGTTLIQANELGMHGIGIDVSAFNCVISNTKLQNYDTKILRDALQSMKAFVQELENEKIQQFDQEVLAALSLFNNKHFPSPQFKVDVFRKKINEDVYAQVKEKEFKKIYDVICRKYKIQMQSNSTGSFVDKWFVESVRSEIDALVQFVKKQKDVRVKQLLAVVLSRTARSCRATTHSDLATLKEPQFTAYYCYKHKKICKPLFSIRKMLDRYADDTLLRIERFSTLKTDAFSGIIAGDSRTVDIVKEMEKKNPLLAALLQKKKINGIFSSPPYVGQIDYHEQHAYAYDLFGFARKDKAEIGPLWKGQGQTARDEYVAGIATVLNNCKKYLADNYDIFLVANDKWNLYPTIAEKAGMQIVQRFKRPVLNRTERDRNPYSETIFHMKKAG